ncbi:MAG TPA: TetR/AcrR family transcriptional regulator [Burkholderiales bacterium]|nr:TetR/AcrR family transcriptional regulator [Burkholderiales bacterium]
MAPSQRILDLAEHLVQTRGYNGFSYADIAASLGVTKASLHYHFPAKAALGRELIGRYERNFLTALAAIDARAKSPREKLRRYAGIYADVLAQGRMCLCGMLAAEYTTLPKAMQQELKHYFAENERWLAAVLEEGRRSGGLAFAGSARDAASLLVSSLEGAMLLARSHGNVKRFRALAERLVAHLAA